MKEQAAGNLTGLLLQAADQLQQIADQLRVLLHLAAAFSSIIRRQSDSSQLIGGVPKGAEEADSEETLEALEATSTSSETQKEEKG